MVNLFVNSEDIKLISLRHFIRVSFIAIKMKKITLVVNWDIKIASPLGLVPINCMANHSIKW